MPGLYQTKGPELDGLGYRPLPCKGKAPIVVGWQDHPPEAREYHRYNGTTNVGILTGGDHNLIAIDVDVRCEATAMEIEGLLEDELGFAPKRIGEAPKALYVFRSETPTKKRATEVHQIGGQKCLIEILGEGQQFVSHGIHPGTKQPYNWPNDDITDYPIGELPVVTKASLDEFMFQAEAVLIRKEDFKFKAPPTEPWGCVHTPPNQNSEYLNQLKNRTGWHDPMLKLTASYVAKGHTREEIMRLLEVYTWDGYTVEQTCEQLGEMIDGALKKDFAPKGIEQPKSKLRTLSDLRKMEFKVKPPLHPWLSSGCMLLAGRPKAGKSLLAEHLAYEIAKEHRLLFLALEYNLRLADHRFKRHMQNETVDQNFRFLAEGDIPRFDQGGAEQLEEHLIEFNPALVVIDTIGKFKRPGETKGYEGETLAMSEVRLLANKFDADLLVIHHTRKRLINDEADIFDQILGSTGLSAVPDTLMVLEATAPPLATIHVKSRLLLSPREIIIELKDGEFIERTEAGATLVGKADVRADILNLLEEEGPLIQKEIAKLLGLREPNVSSYCKHLELDRRIKREKRGSPWELIPAQSSLGIGV